MPLNERVQKKRKRVNSFSPFFPGIVTCQIWDGVLRWKFWDKISNLKNFFFVSLINSKSHFTFLHFNLFRYAFTSNTVFLSFHLGFHRRESERERKNEKVKWENIVLTIHLNSNPMIRKMEILKRIKWNTQRKVWSVKGKWID